MRDRRLVLLIGLICLLSGWMFLEPGAGHPMAHAQQPAAPTASDLQVFRAETRLVLVDTVVTDKKGNYIRDLAQKDFKVWEDGKEQPITSFSFEESTGSPNARRTTSSCSLTTPRWTLAIRPKPGMRPRNSLMRMPAQTA